MDGEERRKKILEQITESEVPLSGTYLAKLFDVSRQVIVQDVALLRAKNKEIISTSSGYMMQNPSKPQRLFCVVHDDASILDELFTIVDLGGYIIDVQIQHQTYGNFAAVLNIKSRKDAEKLVESISSGNSTPLKNLTQNKHCHLVQADSNEDLDAIEKELRKKGYLCDN